jgi:hypothetical protein
MLIQYNIAWMRVVFSDPLWDDFKSQLDIVHKAAENSPGFIDRLHGEQSEPGFIEHAPLVMGNLSAWASYEALHAFTFGEPHYSLLRNKRKWFEAPRRTPYNVMYYSDQMDLREAMDNLSLFQIFGSKYTPCFNWSKK